MDKPKAIAIIQARMSSSRLPGKVLKPLAGKPMIWHIVQRARACQLVNRVVVVTSIEPSDDALADYCKEAAIEFYRGSLDNVLSRFLAVLDLYSHDYFVRITGDCPLIYPEFIDCQIHTLTEHDGDMIHIPTPSTLIGGQGVISSRSLHQVAENSNHPDDFEHVGSRYFAENPELFKIVGMHIPEYLQDNRWRLTVDEEADYQLMAKIYQALWQGKPIDLIQVVQWLEAHPEEAAVNKLVGHSAINKELEQKRKKASGAVKIWTSWPNQKRT